MPGVGFNTFFPKQVNTVFVVRNVDPGRKRVRVFNYPIPYGMERDLMTIPEVSEADIRHSLLKGTLAVKFRAGELVVVESNIDLLQFDSTQKAFLQSIGVMDGLEATGGSSPLNFAFKQNVELVGAIDSSNTTFTVPSPDKFINGTFGANVFKIQVKHNGRVLAETVDYTVSESGGAGTGFDTVEIISFIPIAGSTMLADYVVAT